MCTCMQNIPSFFLFYKQSIQKLQAQSTCKIFFLILQFLYWRCVKMYRLSLRITFKKTFFLVSCEKSIILSDKNKSLCSTVYFEISCDICYFNCQYFCSYLIGLCLIKTKQCHELYINSLLRRNNVFLKLK